MADLERARRWFSNQGTVPRGRLDIRKATYGTLDADIKRPETLRFVTTQVRDLVDHTPQGDVLSIEASFNALFGDPIPDENKVLKIYYTTLHGETKVSVIPEGSTVFIDARRYNGPFRMVRRFGCCPDDLSDETSCAATGTPRALETDDVLRLILSFLPLHPDRLRSMSVCRSWRDFLTVNGLAERFSVGVPDCEGVPCYLNMPLDFFHMVFSRSMSHLVLLDLGAYSQMTDEVLSPALKGNPQLRWLDLSACTLLTETSLSTIGESCPELVSLSLKRLEALTDTCVINVTERCKNLEILNVSDCVKLTDKSISKVGSSLQRLRVLHAKDLHLVTNDAVSSLLEGCGARIETLSLWSMHRLTGQGLAPMGGRCPKLASLNLSECFGLDDAALIPTVCACTNLVNLNLMNCHLITDRTIEVLARRLLKLEHLNLRYMMSITDEGLDALGNSLEHLRSLNLTHCISITQRGVVDLCRRLTLLSELSLASCEQFDNQTVEEIAKACAKRPSGSVTLDLLDMRGVSSVTPASASVLTKELNKIFVARDGLYMHSPTMNFGSEMKSD